MNILQDSPPPSPPVETEAEKEKKEQRIFDFWNGTVAAHLPRTIIDRLYPIAPKGYPLPDGRPLLWRYMEALLNTDAVCSYPDDDPRAYGPDGFGLPDLPAGGPTRARLERAARQMTADLPPAVAASHDCHPLCLAAALIARQLRRFVPQLERPKVRPTEAGGFSIHARVVVERGRARSRERIRLRARLIAARTYEVTEE